LLGGALEEDPELTLEVDEELGATDDELDRLEELDDRLELEFELKLELELTLEFEVTLEYELRLMLELLVAELTDELATELSEELLDEEAAAQALVKLGDENPLGFDCTTATPAGYK